MATVSVVRESGYRVSVVWEFVFTECLWLGGMCLQSVCG